VINYKTEDLPARVRALTGDGIDRIFELNLSANGPLYAQILAPGGTAVIYGTDAAMAEIPAMNFIRRGATLKWFIVYDIDDKARAAGVADLNKMLADGSLKTTIAGRFPLDDIVAAHEMVEAAKHIGNVIVDID